ncbi:MAG TPA: hypothetical protein VGX23_03480 [Actinocrinis sp.]|nr:hypothetical protein [Actinocrinis sp.]
MIGSQIVVGDGTVHVSILTGGVARIDQAGGTPILRAAAMPVLATVNRAEPVGRADVVALAAADVRAGRSVQLVGAPGTGRLAVAQAVVRTLAQSGLRGVQLFGSGEPWTLRRVYEQLAKAYFSVVWDNPDEAALAAAAERAGAGAGGVLLIADCDLEPADLTRLTATFPACVFLLTSQLPTLSGDATACHEVVPLTPAQARELLTRNLAPWARGLPGSQVDEAYRLSEGRPQRLLQHAAFLQRAAARPEQTDRIPVPFPEQIALLVAGLTEPAGRVLVALADFDVPIEAALMPAILGLDVGSAVADLAAAHLVRLDGPACRIDPDAANAVAGRRADPRTAAAGLLPYLADGPLPGPRLLLAVARKLSAAGDPACTSGFARAAAPAVLAAGDTDAWKQLLALGVQAATASGRKPDLDYFLAEQHTAHLLTGDVIGAAAVFLLLAESLRGGPGAPNPPVSAHPRPRGRGARRHGRRALTAAHGVAAATITVIVVVIVTTTVIVTKPGSGSAPSPRTTATGSASGVVTGPLALAQALSSWTVETRDAPSIPYTGTALTYAVTAEYPVITAGVSSPTELHAFNQFIQQPIVDFNDSVSGAAQESQQADGGPAQPGGGELTVVTKTGGLLSIEYLFFASDNAGGSYGQMRIVRMADGSELPQTAILSPAAESPSGLATITNAINSRLPAGYTANGCPAPTTDQVATGLHAPDGKSAGGIGLGLLPAGVDFLIGAGNQNCIVGDVIVPYSELTGLVGTEALSLVNRGTNP